MFGLLPSIYGLAAAVAFAALSLLALNDDHMLEATGLALLAFAYLLRHIPKLFVFGILNLVAHAAFLVGAAMFAYSVANQMALI